MLVFKNVKIFCTVQYHRKHTVTYYSALLENIFVARSPGSAIDVLDHRYGTASLNVLLKLTIRHLFFG